MKTTTTRARGKPDAEFLSAPDLARLLGNNRADTVMRWVAKGVFPPPWTTLGPVKRVWRADHYAEFKATGQWPDEAWRDFPRKED